ncbi:MAG: S8 family serine peptidase, partial [Flavobacteriales bacterium]|nr:S8 family serine peptidase [Flavobacteriales bacterium]
MKKKYQFSFSFSKKISLLFFIFIFSISFSQPNYTIYFQEEVIEFPENIQNFAWGQLPAKSHFNNGYFGWIQFYETPNQATQNEFKSRNLKLLEYIPHQTYLFYFPKNTSVEFLRNNGVRGIIPVDGKYKISKELNHPPFEPWAMDGSNNLVTLQFHENVTTQYVINELAKLQIKVKQEYKNTNLIDLSIPDNCIEELANLPFVKWIELIVAPDIKDDTRGRSLHRANGLDTQTSTGNNYTGVGVGVLVRDDGIVGPHIDFQGRLDNTYASGSGQTHGDGVAGIMAGAGNRNPTMRGMAAGADVYASNYVSNFLDTGTNTLINNGSVQITNSSYSNGCNAGYTTIANTVDQQTVTNPSLMHVFSAGNSNNNNCGYGAGTQWGNITGGHKQGKNVIATANVFFDGVLANSSSRGPAHDGRIKPDITANGQNQNSTSENNNYLVFGGTSAAAPGIAGVSAQLYELYAEFNGGDHPPSGLVKAALLNTANDYGNVGPDYKFGWGIVNGTRAGKLIEEERYLTATVSQGNTNTHTINVPSGTTQVRFMVYWTDPAAAAGANPALVNDLDLVVKNPSNTSFLPWILDPTPNPTNLDAPATNGIDRLNNMEQVLFNTPDPGNYSIEVTGFNVPFGPQEYFVVYEIISENLVLTYPNGEESFVPGEQEAIHWDATNTSDNFLLEYSTNNGGSWTTITTVNSSLRLFSWTIPGSISGEALIRISSGAFQDVSDTNFSIANLVTGLQVTQLCPEEATFNWNAVANANAY